MAPGLAHDNHEIRQDMATIDDPTIQVENLHVRELTRLQSPAALKAQLPSPAAATHTVAHARAAIRRYNSWTPWQVARRRHAMWAICSRSMRGRANMMKKAM